MIDETLTALTDIKMPHYAPLAQASGSIDLNGTILPEYCFWAVARQDGELPSS
ncbi:hypothetical protein MLN23_13230 [Escherichia coli]|nr:hypothetical protein [Escherichia coli]